MEVGSWWLHLACRTLIFWRPYRNFLVAGLLWACNFLITRPSDRCSFPLVVYAGLAVSEGRILVFVPKTFYLSCRWDSRSKPGIVVRRSFQPLEPLGKILCLVPGAGWPASPLTPILPTALFLLTYLPLLLVSEFFFAALKCLFMSWNAPWPLKSFYLLSIPLLHFLVHPEVGQSCQSPAEPL